MKSIIKSIFLFCVLAVSLTSCETYSDPKVEYSPVYPLSGEWRVRIRNLKADTLVNKAAMYTFGTFNTSDNATNQIWVRTTSAIPTFITTGSTPKTILSKITCDVPSLSFSTTGIVQNINTTTAAVLDTITITEGKVTLSSVLMPSGVMSDRISFKITKSKVSGGVTFLVDGYRRTRWAEDETFIAFK
jgi:hypothetical protein